MYENGPVSHTKHKLDVYIPKSSPYKSLLPVVVHVHGGGWVRGDRKSEFYGGPYMGREYCKLGFITVVTSYRTTRIAKHPAQIEDTCKALSWVYREINKFGGDPNKIFLSGHSAGGHIISLIALHPKYLSDVGLKNSIIKGVISISGIYSLLYPLSIPPEDLSKPHCVGWKSIIFNKIYIRPNFGEDKSVLIDASPITHLNKNTPPFLVLNAGSDLGLEFGGQYFVETMKSKGLPVSYCVLTDFNHASITRCEPTTIAARSFINDILEKLILEKVDESNIIVAID